MGPGRIAVNQDRFTYDIGDKVSLVDKYDNKHQVEVVAIIDAPKGLPSLGMDFLTVNDSLPKVGENYVAITTIVADSSSKENSISQQIRDLNVKVARIESRQAYIDRFVTRGVEGKKRI